MDDQPKQDKMVQEDAVQEDAGSKKGSELFDVGWLPVSLKR